MKSVQKTVGALDVEQVEIVREMQDAGEVTSQEKNEIETTVWSGPDDPRRPRFWSLTKKWTATLVLSAIAFLQPLAETALAPVEGQISRDLKIEDAYEWMLVNSLILVGIGISSMLLAPLSEIYGRKPILLAGSISFTVWNTGCGSVSTLTQMFALRILSGFGASVGDSIAGGVLSDLWKVEARGRAYAVCMAAPLLGTAIGPICGTFISEGANWRWVFWMTSITSVVAIFIAIAFLHETYEPRCEKSLRQKRDSKSSFAERSSKTPGNKETFTEVMRLNLQRPFRMLGTQIIVQLLAIYMAILYGIMWLFLFMYPRMWTDQYQQDIRIASLNYLSFGFGLVAGVNIAGHFTDRVYTYLKARSGGTGRPEFRVPTMVIGTVLAPVGLLWWGWSGEAKLHWIMPNIGSFIFAMGIYVCSTCVSVYTIDTYTQYAASAISTNLVLRGITAAFFPLFAPYMFDSLGFGYGGTALAVGFGIFGLFVMSVLWFYGETLRSRSPYCAAGNDDQ
ncbi:hypothetical protein DL768_004158 [Monosporascus sp. mg162]|nr:hypothetical protein DL768_004158 [Monosporascus sp. mg162]